MAAGDLMNDCLHNWYTDGIGYLLVNVNDAFNVIRNVAFYGIGHLWKKFQIFSIIFDSDANVEFFKFMISVHIPV